MSSNTNPNTMPVLGGDGDSSAATLTLKQPRQFRLTEAQRLVLEEEFQRNSKPSPAQREEIAVKCGKPERWVGKWYCQRRKDSNPDVANNPSASASHGIGPRKKQRRSLGQVDPEYISEEERILFNPIISILTQLNRLYAQNPSVSVERAVHWAATLGMKKPDPPGIIEQWLNHRRLDDKEFGKPLASPQNLPVQPPSTDPNPPHSRAATHLPTPSSPSPSPRIATLHFKDEPKSPLPLFAPPLYPIAVGNRNPSRRQSVPESPTTGSSHPNSPVEFAHPSGPVHQRAQHPPSSPTHQPLRVQPQDFSNFVRSQYPNRAAFDAAVQKIKVEDADGALAAFTRMGREAADAITELKKVLQQNPS